MSLLPIRRVACVEEHFSMSILPVRFKFNVQYAPSTTMRTLGTLSHRTSETTSQFFLQNKYVQSICVDGVDGGELSAGVSRWS